MSSRRVDTSVHPCRSYSAVPEELSRFASANSPPRRCQLLVRGARRCRSGAVRAGFGSLERPSAGSRPSRAVFFCFPRLLSYLARHHHHLLQMTSRWLEASSARTERRTERSCGVLMSFHTTTWTTQDSLHFFFLLFYKPVVLAQKKPPKNNASHALFKTPS